MYIRLPYLFTSFVVVVGFFSELMGVNFVLTLPSKLKLSYTCIVNFLVRCDYLIYIMTYCELCCYIRQYIKTAMFIILYLRTSSKCTAKLTIYHILILLHTPTKKIHYLTIMEAEKYILT